MLGSGVLDAIIRQAIERAVAAERARCAAVCREVAERWARGERVGALECAEAIERGAVGT